MEIAAAGRSHRALFLSLEPHRQGLLTVTLAAVGGRTLVTERRRPAGDMFEAQALHSEA